MNVHDRIKFIEKNTMLGNCTKQIMTVYELKELLRKFEDELNKNALSPLVSIRYFAVGYVANVPNGHITGLLDVTTNGKYLNRNLTIGNIKEKQPSAKDIVITTITEMSKEDFEAWTNEC